MALNRRAFLQNLSLILPVAAVRPTYFLPPLGGWHNPTSLSRVARADEGTLEVTAHRLVRHLGSDLYIVEFEWVSYMGIRLS
jgi:hypothetical protein